MTPVPCPFVALVTDALEGARQILAHSMGAAERPVPALIHICKHQQAVSIRSCLNLSPLHIPSTTPRTLTLAPAPWCRLIARVTGWRAAVGAWGVLTALGTANRRAIFSALVNVCNRVGTWCQRPEIRVCVCGGMLMPLPVAKIEKSLGLASLIALKSFRPFSNRAPPLGLRYHGSLS